MPKDVHYPHFIGVKISDEQYNKIKLSGKSTTAFIREAIDFYNDARLSSFTAMKMNVIKDCVGVLNVFLENVKNSDENTFNLMNENVKSVKQIGDDTLNKTSDLLNESDENVKPIVNVKRDELNELEENVKQEEIEKQQKNWEQVKQTLRNMTTAKGRPSHEDFRRQAKKCGKTKAELERYYTRHINFFQQDCI